MKRFVLLCLILSIVPFAGCANQTVKDSWKFTKRQYRNYLNVPAELDYDDTGSCEVYEVALGEAMLDVDNALLKLIRAMENSDRGPDQAWVMDMMQKFPWLSGVALVDQTGAVRAQYPEYFAKEFDVTPLLEPDPKQPRSALRSYAKHYPAGAEVYLANPVYVGEEFRGMVVAFFDPRALMSLSTDPGNIILASPYGVLWPGRFTAESTAVGQTDWEDVLRRRSCGLVGSGEGKFYWTTRYLGNMPLAYAFPVSAAQAKEDARKSVEDARKSEEDVKEPKAHAAVSPQEEETPAASPAGDAPAAPQEGSSATSLQE